MPEAATTSVTVGAGEPGGKGRGFRRLQELVATLRGREDVAPFVDRLAFPRTVFVATGVFEQFVEHNGLADVIRAAETGGDDGYAELRRVFRAGRFPEATHRELCQALAGLSGPLAVRSSSLLEDQQRASFAGKYESVLIGNQGERPAREAAFLDAVRQVFASTFNPSAVAYRHKRGLAGAREAMALLVQQVVGRRWGRYHFPALAGVAFSQNGYCWSKGMRKEDGLVRLVLGLGTRAVGRGYVRLFSPPRPELRPEGTDVNGILKCSQKNVDVIDLEANELKTVHFRELIGEGQDHFTDGQAMISLKDGNHLYRPISSFWDPAHVPVLTLDGVLAREWLGMNVPRMLGWVLGELERGLGFAVDVEFAIDAAEPGGPAKLFLLQTRPLSQAADREVRPVPANLRDEDVICRVRRNLPTAYVPDLEYLVWVDDVRYNAWPHQDKQTVARVVGRLNEALQGRRFGLIGPGRWGSWNPELGVPVRYSEICNTALLVEVARRKATFIPEVSMGSHFFQDLIEDNIAYLPVYPDEAGERFDATIFEGPNALAELLGDPLPEGYEELIRVAHLPSLTGGRRAHAVLDGEAENAAVFIR